ncbi:uncharacterized protein ISCGN_002251 [Ixodes scapularis]
MVKPFAVVKFPEEKDSLAAVPVGWLSEDELFCTWPMHVKGCQLISLVEAQAPPGVVGKGWEVFPVIVIKTYWTYKKAAKKVRQYVWTSTVETSDFSANEALPGVEAAVSHPPLRMPSPPINWDTCGRFRHGAWAAAPSEYEDVSLDQVP